MPCDLSPERVYEFIDRQLPADLDTEVREHLAICDDCRREADHQRSFLARLGRVELPVAPEALRDRVRSVFETRHG